MAKTTGNKPTAGGSLSDQKSEIRSMLPSVLGCTILLLLGIVLGMCKYPVVIPVVLFFLGLHLWFFGKAKVRLFINLGFLIAILIFGVDVINSYPHVTPLYIPVASFTMLTMLLFNDLQLVFMMSFIASTIASLMTGSPISFMLTFFLSGLTGAYAVRGARTRGRLITAGIYVGLIQVLCALLLNPVVTPATFELVIKPLLINGFICFFIVVSTLKIFETIFGEVTNFTLLELADASSQPLLKRMITEAPGTYHHSLIVSNLSEAAAEAIGANSLLARVGAYYHDIGKMVTPEYFTENQLVSGNKHDDLEPSMSRLVILNHVKEGIELARKHRLNQKIVDFIPQHHGTGLIFYFYQRALEEANGQGVEEENYRYPGPRPQSRETAIVMLADSVEGATRSLQEHSSSKIDDVVRKVINNRFIDGQLDECNLTLREIELISSTFSRVLTVMYHGRVRYPEKKTNGHHNKKSPDENSHPPASS
ncbi:MAG: HDIG domain-containing protein [Candidatus Omnitrophica bacterium]|nr:HDIG domain-containing protein [Candidatus Omnitrophota bacterium]